MLIKRIEKFSIEDVGSQTLWPRFFAHSLYSDLLLSPHSMTPTPTSTPTRPTRL